MQNILSSSPADVASWLRFQGITRAHLVFDPSTGRVRASHDALQPLADFLDAEERDFLDHEGVFFEVARDHDSLLGAFVHKTVRGQAAGGVRNWTYDTLEDWLRDGLRLAVGMTRKNALAGLWWGGGKGVIARDPRVDRDDRALRDDLYGSFGDLMTALRGCYVTAEDVGTAVEDMECVFRRTRFTTCIPPSLGGSGNPSVPTARGVVAGIAAALEFLDGGTIEGRCFAVQGVGHVGQPVVEFLLERGAASIVACDVDPGLVDAVRAQVDGRVELNVVDRGDTSIFDADCDVFVPCATGAILNDRTIPRLRAKVVCGAANNQLEDPVRDDVALQERGILYVPDFLTNRMGIVTCADESAGYVVPDPNIEQHLGRDWEYSIHRTTLDVLTRARDEGRPTSAIATARADELAEVPHPVFGHRGAQIIEGLVRDRWFAD